MTARANNLKKDFLGLSRLEQLELMQYFLQVFATKPLSEKEQQLVLSDEWKAELDRRSKEIELGRVKLLDNDEVLAKLGL